MFRNRTHEIQFLKLFNDVSKQFQIPFLKNAPYNNNVGYKELKEFQF